MPIVRGDRIGLSGKLSRCSTDAQTAYAHLVAAVPDDFGRFQVRWLPIMARLYPNLDDARRIGRAVTKWKARFAEYEREGLIATWVVDGVTYAEFSGFVSSGNHWHRTPEPDWSWHEHGKRCLSTAIHCARVSKDSKTAERLSIRLKTLRAPEPDRSPTGARPDGGTPSPSSPSSPSYQIVRKEEPPTPTLPPADRAERAIRLSTDALRTKLYALIDAMAQEDPDQADPTELMRMVTAYDRPDGARVKGVVNAALLTHERLERSIADAEAQLAEWRAARGTATTRTA